MNSTADPANPADIATPPQPRSRGKLILYALYAVIGLAVIAGLILGGKQLAAYIPRFAQWVEGLGFWGPVVFILGYAVATVAFIPGSLLTLAAGAIFGLVEGTIYTLIGATLGSSGAFLVARYLARRKIERKIAGNAKFAAIDRAVGREGFKIVALLRLSPAFPFSLLNYALGLTQVTLPAVRRRLDRHAARNAALRLLRQGRRQPRGPGGRCQDGEGPRLLDRPGSRPRRHHRRHDVRHPPGRQGATPGDRRSGSRGGPPCLSPQLIPLLIP